MELVAGVVFLGRIVIVFTLACLGFEIFLLVYYELPYLVAVLPRMILELLALLVNILLLVGVSKHNYYFFLPWLIFTALFILSAFIASIACLVLAFTAFKDLLGFFVGLAATCFVAVCK